MRPILRKLFPLALLPILLALLVPATASAQPASPALIARIAGINSEAAQSRKLILDNLDLDVRIHGSIAETSLTARFANAGADILEGEFTLMLPPGSVV